MESRSQLFVRLRESSVGQWLYAGGYGIAPAILGILLYLLPAVLILSLTGYLEDYIKEPGLWLWAGASCGYLWGVSDGKHQTRAQEQQ